MALTPKHVELSLRPEPDHGPEDGRTPHSEDELEALASRWHAELGDDELWVFAYGSLIWKPDFEAIDRRHAVAYGWHRSFCLKMNRWRGSPDQLGLMLALEPGGRCDGIAFRLPDENRHEQIKRLILREIPFREFSQMIRWIKLRTAKGPIRAMAFWAGPRGERVISKLPLEEVAWILARACGHAGSCAEYLYNTVAHLDDFGIRDRNLWHLQELVAREIAAIHRLPSEGK